MGLEFTEDEDLLPRPAADHRLAARRGARHQARNGPAGAQPRDPRETHSGRGRRQPGADDEVPRGLPAGPAGPRRGRGQGQAGRTAPAGRIRRGGGEAGDARRIRRRDPAQPRRPDGRLRQGGSYPREGDGRESHRGLRGQGPRPPEGSGGQGSQGGGHAGEAVPFRRRSEDDGGGHARGQKR